MSFAKTLEARLAATPDLARTLVDRPGMTIEPTRSPSSGAMAALEALRTLGATLGGRIDLHETLGEGGMGIVHLGTQATLGRHVAVKTLRKGVLGDDAVLRILREAWVTGTLEHPNVVPVHDVGVDADGAPVIVMKRIEGRSWSELMHDPAEIAKRFGSTDPLEWNLRTLASVCNAVHFAHSRGILHRDLKPENVMIGEFGEVYVLDWGIAVSLRDDPSGRLPPVSQAKEIAGTPHYMAPEMLLGDPALLSARTDVYLLGAIFYEVFAGKPPHDADTLHAMLSVILLSSPSFAPTFPPEARRVCERALSREPEGRYATALELRLAVEEYLRHRGSRKLAHDAKQSLVRLQEAIAREAADDDRKLAVANLLGECRFGYHAALSAWPGNEVARLGLDRALLLVIELELAEGAPAAAATLLRDVSAPPPDVAARVAAALRTRAGEDERLHQMEVDHDPRIGTRTRGFLAGAFGVAWAASTCLGWYYTRRGGPVSYFAVTVAPSLFYLCVGLAAFVWARETLRKTLLNRRMARSLFVYLVLQTTLGAGGWLLGIPWNTMHVLFLFEWALAYALLAVWVETWFGALAAACAVSFLVASGHPAMVYPLMSGCCLLMAFVIVRFWLPREDVDKIRERRAKMRQRAHKWLLPGLGKE